MCSTPSCFSARPTWVISYQMLTIDLAGLGRMEIMPAAVGVEAHRQAECDSLPSESFFSIAAEAFIELGMPSWAARATPWNFPLPTPPLIDSRSVTPVCALSPNSTRPSSRAARKDGPSRLISLASPAFEPPASPKNDLIRRGRT